MWKQSWLWIPVFLVNAPSVQAVNQESLSQKMTEVLSQIQEQQLSSPGQRCVAIFGDDLKDKYQDHLQREKASDFYQGILKENVLKRKIIEEAADPVAEISLAIARNMSGALGKHLKNFKENEGDLTKVEATRIWLKSLARHIKSLSRAVEIQTNSDDFPTVYTVCRKIKSFEDTASGLIIDFADTHQLPEVCAEINIEQLLATHQSRIRDQEPPVVISAFSPRALLEQGNIEKISRQLIDDIAQQVPGTLALPELPSFEEFVKKSKPECVEHPAQVSELAKKPPTAAFEDLPASGFDAKSGIHRSAPGL